MHENVKTITYKSGSIIHSFIVFTQSFLFMVTGAGAYMPLTSLYNILTNTFTPMILSLCSVHVCFVYKPEQPKKRWEEHVHAKERQANKIQ